MSRQILSIYGLYQYDKTIFDGFKLPEGLMLDYLIPELLMELGVLETIYPDPDFMKSAIASWSAKEFPVWEELYNTTKYEYDPISNYDRTEESDVKRTGKNTDKGSGNSTSNIINKIAAFNDPELLDRESANGTGNNSFNNEHGIDETLKVKRTVKGNIGVTTTQQMIDEQRRSVKFNIYDYIIDSFKARFCIMVY